MEYTALYAAIGINNLEIIKFLLTNEEYGVNLVKLSCDSYDKIGLNTYGYIYYNGIAGYQKDYLKVFYYFKRSADLGYSIASTNIGNAYLYGKGVSKDLVMNRVNAAY